jgi:spore coat polysaccharide biosynthesis protein SpsF
LNRDLIAPLLMEHVLIISQARLGSSRLPGKVLLKAGQETLIMHHIERLRSCGYPICIATTSSSQDQYLYDYLEQLGCDVFKGDEEDVLSRYYHCAKARGATVIVRVTSDCPLIDGALVRQGVDEYLNRASVRTYLSNVRMRTFPRGFDFEVFSFELLEEAFLRATSPIDREHVTPYIRRACEQDGAFIDLCYQDGDASNLRITVDTEPDFILVKELIEDFGCIQKNADEIIKLLNDHPALAEINSHVEQKKAFGTT